MSGTLFGAKLDALHPGTMLRTESRSHMLARKLAAVAPPPTNEEILEAAKTMYHAHSDAVDKGAMNGQQYALSSEGRPNVAALNAYNWKSQQASPVVPVTQKILAAPLIKGSADAAASHSDVWSFAIGISEAAQLLVGEEGGIGVAFALRPPTDVKGVAYIAGKLGLEIDIAVNLQLGLWKDKPSDLGADFWGLEVSVDVEVAISLGIFGAGQIGTPNQRFAGFAIGIGVGLGGGASIVGGHTWVFG
jgi:hypothetical protein